MNNSSEGNGYDAMAQAVKASVEELLIPFHVVSDAPQFLRTMSTDEFFRKFLVYADKFTDQCCHELSKIFRQASVLPEVRGTPTLELAKQVRQTVFEKPDKILISYVDSLNQVNLDLGETASNLSNSSVLAEAMKGAAIGRVAGGFGDGGKVLGAVGAIAAAGKEAMKQQILLEQQHKLVEEARDLAFSKIVEYLKTIEALPENLLDYGCAKCFGGQIDFSKQALAIEQVGGSIKDKMRQSLELTLTLQQIEKAAQKTAAAEKQKEVEKSEKSANKGCGGCMVALGALALIGAVAAMADSKSEESAVGGFFMVAAVLIAAGIYTLTKDKKKTP